MAEDLNKKKGLNQYSENKDDSFADDDTYNLAPYPRITNRKTDFGVNRSDFDSDEEFELALARQQQLTQQDNSRPKVDADLDVKTREDKHSRRMSKMGRKRSVTNQMLDNSLINSSDVIVRPPDGSENILRISPNDMDFAMEDGTGGMSMTQDKSIFKKVTAVDFENDYKDLTLGEKQFDQRLDQQATSVILPRTVFGEQIFPAELAKIAGLASQLKSILGF